MSVSAHGPLRNALAVKTEDCYGGILSLITITISMICLTTECPFLGEIRELKWNIV